MATSNTALAPRDEAQTAIRPWEGLDLPDDGTEGIPPLFTTLKIIQPTSQMPGASKHLGEFFNPDTGEFAPSLDTVALFQKTTRAYFKEGEDQPSCASDDGYAPRPNQPLWTEAPAGTDVPVFCAECPLSQWGQDGTPPPCRESVVLLVDLDGELAQLRIGGKSLKPWRNFVRRMCAGKRGSDGKPRRLVTYRLHLTTQEKAEPSKKWFELMVESEDLTREEIVRYAEVLRYERERFNQATVDAEPDEAEGPAPQWQDGSKPLRTPVPTPQSRPLSQRLEGVIEATAVPADDQWAFRESEEPTS